MTVAAPRDLDRPRGSARAIGRSGGQHARLVLVPGVLLLPLAVVLLLCRPESAVLVAAAVPGVAVLAAIGWLLYRHPEFSVWGAVVLFPVSDELRLRLTPVFGLLKDVYVGMLVVLAVALVIARRVPVLRWRAYRTPLAALGVLTAMYLADPAGHHGVPWLFGTRLLLSVLALLVVGLCTPSGAARTAVRAFTVMLPAEAVFSWLQQAAGAQALVYSWGYQYGAQVRVTTTGGLRTSGTFDDPFQLAAFAVLGLAIGLFATRGRTSALLICSAVAVLGATSVRTAMLQAGVLVLLWLIRRGRWRLAVLGALVAAAAGLLLLSVTTSSIRPGAPEEPLILTLNGRSDAWAQAVEGWESLAVGNGVGARGIGSTRTSTTLSDAPAYDPDSAPTAVFAGNPAFLDSAYAQVLSDVGPVGVLALLMGLGGFAVVLVRRRHVPAGDARTPAVRAGPDAAWTGLAILVTAAVDWVGRASLASYTTGYLTLFLLGVFAAAAVDRPEPPAADVTAPRPAASRTISAGVAMVQHDSPPPAGPAHDPRVAGRSDNASHGGRLARVGLAAALVSRVFGRLVGILLVVLLAREAAPDTVAVYGYLLGTATLVGTLTDLGVASVAGREVAAGRLAAPAALFSALGPQLLSLAVAVLVTCGLTVGFGPAGVPVPALLMTLAFVVVTGLGGLWGELLRATGRVVLEGALQMGAAVALVAGGVVVLQLDGDATDLLIVVLGKEIVVLAVEWALLRPRRDRGVRARSLLSQSIWVAVAGTAVIVLWRQGTVVAGTGGIAALAAYVVASRYLDALVTVAHTAGFGLVPGMSALAADPVAFRRTGLRYLRLAALLGLAVAVIGGLGATWLVRIPFGDRWDDAVPAVRIICVSALPILVAFVAWPMVLARHQVRLLAVACCGAALVGLPVGIVLFVVWGDATAVALGTAVGAVVLAGVMLFGLRDLLGHRGSPVAGGGSTATTEDAVIVLDGGPVADPALGV